MKKIILSCLMLLVFVGLLNAHDMFLKLDSFFLQPNMPAVVTLINGTFDKSENAIARDRMLDVSIVGPHDEVSHPETSQWRDVENEALLDFKTGAAGTYTIGVSTAPRSIELSGTDFNDYLSHDGVLDVLKQREQDGEMDKDAVEKYAKHVKAIIQVGDARSSGFEARLGYPVELVPLQNPYALTKGDELEILFLHEGQPKANQLVYASFDGFHGHDTSGQHVEAHRSRTNEKGVAKIKLDYTGRWYVRLIHMEQTNEEGFDYESKWATLTFEIQ